MIRILVDSASDYQMEELQTKGLLLVPITITIGETSYIDGKNLGRDEFYEILGNKCPCITVPIKPGRNLAIIIEVAAMNNKQRKLGFNAAKELDRKLLNRMNNE